MDITNFERDSNFDQDSPFDRPGYNNNDNNEEYVEMTMKPYDHRTENYKTSLPKGLNNCDEANQSRGGAGGGVIRNRSHSHPLPIGGGKEKPTTLLNSNEKPKHPSKSLRRGGNQSPGTYRGKRMTYAELITEAIMSSPDRSLTLQDIYSWMTE